MIHFLLASQAEYQTFRVTGVVGIGDWVLFYHATFCYLKGPEMVFS